MNLPASTQTDPAPKPPRLGLVVPCFNEAQPLPATIAALDAKLEALSKAGLIRADSFVLLVDDGSTDATWALIEQACADDPRFEGLRLAVNAGQQTAIFAGLRAASDRCDAALSLDADLQDDLATVDAMLAELAGGAEIVLGVRAERDSDSWFKRQSAGLFYQTARLLGVDLTPDHGDFRLIAQPTLGRLLQFGEHDLFLRATPSLLSREIAVVRYRRLPREAGSSHYPLMRMVALGWTGISSFSLWPLRLITITGGLTSVLALVLAAYALLAWASGSTVAGWTSIFVALTLFSGLTLLALGIIGEYVAKIYREVVRRPRYFVQQSTLKEEHTANQGSAADQEYFSG